MSPRPRPEPPPPSPLCPPRPSNRSAPGVRSNCSNGSARARSAKCIAHGTLLQREVALKLLRADRGTVDKLGEKVIREARILARVRHPNVVTVHGAERTTAGSASGWNSSGARRSNICCERTAPFSAREAAFIGQDLCRALAAVHAAGLVHRDVKAQNVMREEGGPHRPDGLRGGGRLVGDNAAAGRIRRHAAVSRAGSARRGAKRRSAAISTASASCCITSSPTTHPIRARSLDELRVAHGENRRVRLHDARPDSLPDSLVRVIERATDPTPERRYATAGEMQSELVQAGGIGLPVVAPALPNLPEVAPAPAGPSVADRIRALATRPAILATAAMLALAVTAALIYRSVIEPGPVAPPLTVHAIAVLPLERGDGIQDYQAEDITDGIAQILSMDNKINVISRQSVKVALGMNLTTKQIAERLKVDALVEGRVAREDQTLRMNMRLISAGTDASFWSAEFQVPVADSRALQRGPARRWPSA